MPSASQRNGPHWLQGIPARKAWPNNAVPTPGKTSSVDSSVPVAPPEQTRAPPALPKADPIRKEEVVLHSVLCPSPSVVLVLELISLMSLLSMGVMALLELSQFATLTIGTWTGVLLGLFAPLSMLRPLAWNYLVSTHMDVMFPTGGDLLRWRLKREVTDALLRDFMLQAVSLACVFGFYSKRNGTQIEQFNHHRYDTSLTIDVRLFSEWFSCMSFLVFAMMSNVLSFHRLFYLQIGLTRNLHKALQEL